MPSLSFWNGNDLFTLELMFVRENECHNNGVVFFIVENSNNMLTWLHQFYFFLSVAQSAMEVFSVIDMENVM
jgi:hypothetical protein